MPLLMLLLHLSFCVLSPGFFAIDHLFIDSNAYWLFISFSVVHGSATENKNGKFMGFAEIEIDDTLPVTVQWHND